MIPILISAILFGLVHPGAKVVMNQGLSLMPFCLLYIGIRLVAQIPLVIAKRSWKIKSKSELAWLFSLGFVGAALQVAEFCGISNGLPIGVVSFLVYTHPIWTILLSRVINGENISKSSIAKLILAVIGVTLITGFSTDFPLKLYLGPLSAGILIALWISLSNKASKIGCTAGAMSFYYDAFSFLILVGLSLPNHGANITEAWHFMGNLQNLLLISTYSILIGLVPNYLFYWGSKITSTQAAGFTLLLEPLISTIVSNAAWSEPMTTSFLFGAIMIMATNFPFVSFTMFFRKRCLPGPVGAGLSLSLLMLCLSPRVALGGIHLVEIVPQDSSEYTVTTELDRIRIASKLAVADYRKLHPTCNPSIETDIRRGSEAELYSTIEKIGTKDDALIVGFSRTNFARIAAKALAKTKVIGISIGAATSTLSEINPNFVSIVSPWSRQWDAIHKHMKSSGCTPTNTIGLFDPKSVLSQKFQESYSSSLSGPSLQLPSTNEVEFAAQVAAHNCAFIALNFSVAQLYIAKLIAKGWTGNIFGIGDWNYFSKEVSNALGEAKYPGLTLIMPTGWVPEATKRSKKFSSRLAKIIGEKPSPISAYTYDAMLIALASSCGGHNPTQFDRAKLSKLPLLRSYEGIAPSGNYLSQMFMITKRSNSNAK